ncbi:MAG: hypothetical protein PHT02_02590 [Tissierellia bacterium]|nr:hypothetical protein [Tissierellia bacterium]
MEKKITKSSNYSSLLLYSLKNKRSWVILSTVIIFVTTLLVPYILNADKEFFILFGIVETFILVFLNCLIDNNFLHNESKLAYYKSKPVSMKTQISINIIVNIMYTGFLLALISLSVFFQEVNYEIFESFKIIIPWLLVGIMLASLSSILSGNTIMAGAMTIFNFCLPLIIYLIILFIFTILENIVIGFSAKVLMDYFINTIYKIEYIYFLKYANKSIDIIYFVILAVIIIFISLLINKFVKRRKNENTGNFIAFDGYKYFVSVLACLIIPASFSIMSYSNDMISKIIVSLILAILTYYIIIALMEKSFRISMLSAKVFIVSIAIFSAVAGGTVIFANQYKNVVPEAEDVKMAYIGTNRYVATDGYIINQLQKNDNESLNNILEWQKINGHVMFTEKDNIENITDLHREILIDQNYEFLDYYLSNLVIVYWMNDGRVIIRDYKLNRTEQTNESEANKNKDEIAYKIINSQEMKQRKYFYLYDNKHYNSTNLICYVSSDITGELIKNIDIDEVRPYLIKDIEKTFTELEDPFLLLVYNFDFYQDKGMKTNKYYIAIEEIANQNHNNNYRFYLNEDFENTLEYLNLK